MAGGRGHGQVEQGGHEPGAWGLTGWARRFSCGWEDEG